MAHRIDNEKQINSYLLGQLSEEERTRIEERFFRDAEYREFIRAIEDDLIDGYVRGEMPPRERELFEGNFLFVPHRHRKVEFARALAEALPESRQACVASSAAVENAGLFRALWSSFLDSLRTPGWTLGFSLATLLLLVIGGLWLINEVRRTRTQTEPLLAEQRPQRGSDAGGQSGDTGGAPPPPPESEGQTATLRPREERPERTPDRKPTAPRPVIASFVFAPGVARNSDESRRLIVSEKTQIVRLLLDLERGDEYRTYGVELRTASGRLIWQRKVAGRGGETASRPSVVVDIPAKLLSSGDYELKLTGAQNKEQSAELGYYYFSLLKR